ncbi:hypothetical protein ANCCEY_04415 [Ancylostoma ceylanicum]|uniref:Uncharacterized protein n=1 Tax=Ancylostoma ceylanicum TaxID=53326 RepID=A0A0D6LWT0_9BILA|nr:hypothetical protein ANCCEY_04415 [Ancylostoma ceylanicum]
MIGLEVNIEQCYAVHVQLNTRSKLFSSAPVADDAAPNTQVAALDMSTPGTLPVLNKACVMIGIIQLQLEQDSGKSIHCGPISLIDLNRAEGHLRVDANVSLTHKGKKGVRTEVKNINSLRHLHTAINFEIDRHYQVISGGGTVVNETRMCDEHGRTVSMRDKEVKTDYRFMPEPNLPTLKIQPEWIEQCARSVASAPTYMKYQELGFEPRRAIFYAENPLLSRFLDSCADRLPNVGAENFVNWMNELKLIMQRSKATYPPENPEFAKQFMAVVEHYVSGKITKLRALEALRLFVTDVQDAEKYFEEKNAWRIADEQTIQSMAEETVRKNGKLVEKAMAGHGKSLSKLRKLLLDESEKKIEVEDAEKAIATEIARLQGSEVPQKTSLDILQKCMVGDLKRIGDSLVVI